MKLEEMYQRKYKVYSPIKPVKEKEGALLIIHSDEKQITLMESNGLLPLSHCYVVTIISSDRLGDYTPWYCAAINEKFPDFAGKADQYIEWISNDFLLHIVENIEVAIPKENIGILGQSLGGLLNFYLYSKNSSFWKYAMCISPSSWYPDFLNYFISRVSSDDLKTWYISSGTQEGVGHKDIKCETVHNTKKIINCLRENSHDVEEYWDDGQHHDYLVERYYKALSWFDNKFR